MFCTAFLGIQQCLEDAAIKILFWFYESQQRLGEDEKLGEEVI